MDIVRTSVAQVLSASVLLKVAKACTLPYRADLLFLLNGDITLLLKFDHPVLHAF